MSEDKSITRDGRQWKKPEIIDIGDVSEQTSANPDNNLRDNQGDSTPKYKVFTLTNEAGEVELPEGE